jgi:ABC-type polysaccharide/polyol phosphate transport system ATPase subunit
VLLIDEVLAVGDAEFRERSTQRITEMVKGASTVVIASHSFGLLEQVCNRAILVDRGRVAAMGEVAEVIAAYKGGSARPARPKVSSTA